MSQKMKQNNAPMESASNLVKQIMGEQRSTCQICEKESPLNSYFKCQHQCCEQCCKQHLTTLAQSSGKITCPFGCKVGLKVEYEQRIQLEPSVKKLWELISLKQSVQSAGMKLCPSCQNNSGLLFKVSQNEDSLYCARCQRIFCSKCLKRKHINNCNILIQASLVQFSQCPDCFFLIQKKIGCSHIKCKCGADFCYECQEYWISGHRCNNFNNKRLRRLQKFRNVKGALRGESLKIEERRIIIMRCVENIRKFIQIQEKKRDETPNLFAYSLKWYLDNFKIWKQGQKYLNIIIFFILLLAFQAILLSILPLLILLNIFFGWFIAIPLIDIIYPILNRKSLIANSNDQVYQEPYTVLLILQVLFKVPLMLILYYFNIMIGGTVFWSRAHLYDIQSILLGEIPFWIKMKRIYVEDKAFFQPLCDCGLSSNINCQVCSNIHLKLKTQILSQQQSRSSAIIKSGLFFGLKNLGIGNWYCFF